jgi:hypothetical protein
MSQEYKDAAFRNRHEMYSTIERIASGPRMSHVASVNEKEDSPYGGGWGR